MINVNLLPKNLQRVQEPGYWRLLAVAFPLLVFVVVFAFQYLAWQTVDNLEREVQAREDQLALLQPFLDEQDDLRARQRELNELIAIAAAVRENRVLWTGEIVGLLEHLPAQGAETPTIDFQSLNVRSVVPPQESEDRYEGAPIIAEMSIGGNVVDLAVLSSFVRALEDSGDYGVLFQNASRQEDEQAGSLYGYSLTVGALQTAEERQ